MKKYLILLFAVLLSIPVLTAQNIQLHYDMGSVLYENKMDKRPKLTSTVEMFKPDKWGNTFFFVDMDYTSDGITSAYWEIARELQFWKAPLLLHIEYNGGLAKGFSYNNAYLGGISYTSNSKDFSKGITLMALYKYIQKHSSPNNFQLTATWFLHFASQGLCTFTGFADWWREKNMHGDFIFMAEPQFWVNLNKIKGIDDKFNLSVGSEMEVTHHFGGLKGWHVVPTLAVKWSFD